MEAARVRAILWRHLADRQGRPDPSGSDPSAFLPLAAFANDLAEVEATEGEEALRALAADYVGLWARTFRTLVRHLRGRPERALALFCDEVYPYLRGSQRAARVEAAAPGTARVAMAGQLPPAYIAGLLESFVALSRADADARWLGGERFVVRYRIHPADRAARLVQVLAWLRVPLLVTAALGVAAGTAVALSAGVDVWPGVVFVAAGGLGAQAGANALHDLRVPSLRGPLDVESPPRPWTWFQMVGSYAAAAGAALWFAVNGRPGILAFAATGIVLSIAYTYLRDLGMGPALAGLIHGPVIVVGTAYALGATGTVGPLAAAVAVSAPLGLLTAALLFLDDLADRPIDEAAGKRTFAVRLPARRHLLAFTGAIGLGTAAAAAAGVWIIGAWGALVAVPAAVVAGRVAVSVARHLDDPRSLTAARVGSLAVHLLVAVPLTAALALSA